MNKDLIKKIVDKKEFSELPIKDVEMALIHFDRPHLTDLEKIKSTRELLHKVFGAFASRKLLNVKDKNSEWILKKHLSTRERFEFYEKIYPRILNGMGKKISIIDLGSGVNGFSYGFFDKLGKDVSYVSVEAVGQLSTLMNNFFDKNKIKAESHHLSLFDTDKVLKLVQKQKKPRVIFLFKVIDSLEMLEKDYSKNFISAFAPFSDRFVLSFATESMISRRKFKANRKWIIDFVKDNFNVLDDFTLGGERFFVFEKN